MPPRGCYRSSAPSPASLGAGGEGMQGALSPGSQIPGPARCSEPTLGASVQYLLCTDPEKLSPSPLAFMASDLRCRSWGPPGRPTWSKDFALAFYPPAHPPQPCLSAPNSARRGRMYRSRHFRCLEGAGRCAQFPGCALPGSKEVT